MPIDTHSVTARYDQSSSAERIQVPRYPGLIKLKMWCYLATAELSLGKESQNLNPIRMGKGLADLGDPLIKRTAHVVVIHSLMHPSEILHAIVLLSMAARVILNPCKYEGVTG